MLWADRSELQAWRWLPMWKSRPIKRRLVGEPPVCRRSAGLPTKCRPTGKVWYADQMPANWRNAGSPAKRRLAGDAVLPLSSPPLAPSPPHFPAPALVPLAILLLPPLAPPVPSFSARAPPPPSPFRLLPALPPTAGGFAHRPDSPRPLAAEHAATPAHTAPARASPLGGTPSERNWKLVQAHLLDRLSAGRLRIAFRGALAVGAFAHKPMSMFAFAHKLIMRACALRAVLLVAWTLARPADSRGRGVGRMLRHFGPHLRVPQRRRPPPASRVRPPRSPAVLGRRRGA